MNLNYRNPSSFRTQTALSSPNIGSKKNRENKRREAVRSQPTFASQSLMGSALGLGTD